ncbi:DUF6273 domain-containing protein [Paenibacillus sp. GCM10028914]|uniref:DUF6273 domain-containing protein n=1 Tax=Paenibacillus sp. GCM10028914 TaxID=3273416 RepID=UPI00360899CE
MTLELQLRKTENLTLNEKHEIEELIEQTISVYKNNRSEINKLTMESVTCLAVSKSRASELASQGLFKRGLNSLNGKNKKIRADIDRNVAKSQYAAQQTIQKLAEQNLLTFDLVMAVNNKLNSLVLDIDQELNQVYKVLVSFFKNTRSDMLQVEARLGILERNVNLLHWNSTIEYQMYKGIEYSELNDVEKVICVVNDFFGISKGEWNTADLMLLKATLSDVGLNIKGSLNYKDFFQYLISKPATIDRLFKDINLEPLKEIQPIYASVVKGIDKVIKISNEEKYIVETISEQLEQSNVSVEKHELKLSIIRQYLKNNAFMITDIDVNVFDFSIELLVNLKMISQGSSQLEVNEVRSIEIGDYVEFGKHKGEKIIWRIINDENDTFMLFSYKFLSNKMPFGGLGYWEKSALRKFLNSENDFLHEFSMNEKNSIIEVDNEYIAWRSTSELLNYDENVVDCCSNYDVAYKRTSVDKVFLLSLLEITLYLRDQQLEFRAISEQMNTFYWLRDMSTNLDSPEKSIFNNKMDGNGTCSRRVRGIFDSGAIGENYFNDHHYVRPALYIKIKSPIGGKGTLEEPYILD